MPAYEEPKRYDFGNKNEFSYQSKEISTTTKLGNNYTNGMSSIPTYNEPVIAEKPKYQPFQPTAPASTITTTTNTISAPKSPSSGGFGFTD